MSRIILNTSIDSVFDNNRADASLTPAMSGAELKKVADYADQQDLFKVDKVSGQRLISATEIIKLSNVSGTNTGDQDLSGKVDKVTGKSVILDTEITRLAGVFNVNISGKENSLNKSTDVTLADATNTKFPTELAVKTYMNANFATTVNTAFTTKTYASVMSIAHSTTSPNFNINLTGNLNLTLTGTANGDSGLVNLYFSASQVATLNGFTNLVITGSGAMIPVYFIHDTNGVKWYKDETGGATIDTSALALKRGTSLFHTAANGYTRTITNIGVNCTTDFIPVSALGLELTKANGEKAVIATIPNATSFTTVEAFTTNSTSVVTSVAPSILIKNDGSVSVFDKDGNKIIALNANGTVNLSGRITLNSQNNIDATGVWTFGQINIDANTSSFIAPAFANYSFKNGNDVDLKLSRQAAGILQILNLTDGLGDLRLRNLISIPATTYTTDAAADADIALVSGSLYYITGDRVPRKKP